MRMLKMKHNETALQLIFMGLKSLKYHTLESCLDRLQFFNAGRCQNSETFR